MRYARAVRMLAALVLVAGIAGFMPKALAGDTDSDVAADSSSARATVRSTTGANLGFVSIQRLRNGHLVVAGQLSGLTAGFHGFHIHAVGICDPRAVDPTGAVVPFFTAGGHLNPGGGTHGNHAGDLPVLLVSDDGTARSLTETDNVTLAQILDADGAAFIIHALPDNLAHIPARYTPPPDTTTLNTGDAGGRIACGVITRS